MIGETVPIPDIGPSDTEDTTVSVSVPPAKEVGGREGLDPTRYGDWEKNGRCIDF